MVKVAEFCPVARQLTIIDKVGITFTFKNPIGDLIHDLNIFSKIASNTFINYPDKGMSALHFDKAFEKPGFTRCNVQWITITDPAKADTIACDYLIVTIPEFFTPNDPISQVAKLANHRSWYNGYSVAVLNIDDILSDIVGFEYEGYPIQTYKIEQRIRTCIRGIWEGANVPNTERFAFVLLVGDNYADNTFMPMSKDHDVWYLENQPCQEKYPTVFYYSCLIRENGVIMTRASFFVYLSLMYRNNYLFLHTIYFYAKRNQK